MPVKWKIFLALNFVLSLPALVCLVLFFINFLNSYNRREDYFFGIVFLFGLMLVTFNGFLNIYLLQRFFPDKLIPVSIKRLNTLSLVLNILVAIAILILCIYAASLEFGHDYDNRDTSGKIILAIIFFLWLVQVIILIMQGQLPGLISRNNRERMHSLIDSIGE
jgi:hypothetical protein